MGNCSSNKKSTGPVKADASKAVQTNAAANNIVAAARDINGNLQAIQGQVQQPADQNAAPKITNLKLKFVAVDESYTPKKAGENRESQQKASANEIVLTTKTFPSTTLIKDCINLIINEPNRNNLKFNTTYRLRNIDLKDKLNSKLEEIIKESDENTEYVFSLVYNGLRNLPAKFNEHIIKNNNHYAYVNFVSDANKELVVFKKDNSSPYNISVHNIAENVFEQDLNEYINEHTTYCNGINSFYFSGCGAKGLSKSFFKISLNGPTQSLKVQQLADMPVELQLHTMIYIPDNYIFVAGGHSSTEQASTNVYFYDIKNDVWDYHSSMKKTRVEHSLCLVNDQYLYAIFGNKNNKTNDEKTIERINLRSGDRQWELITLETFDLNFFSLYSVAQYKNKLILFAFEENQNTAQIEDNNERNLMIDLETNKLQLYSYSNIKNLKDNKPITPLTHSKAQVKEIDQISKLDFFERSFIPLLDNVMILSPYNHLKEKTNLIIIKDGIAVNETFALPKMD